MSAKSSEALLEPIASLTGMCLVAAQACGNGNGLSAIRLANLRFEIENIQKTCLGHRAGDEELECLVDIQDGNGILGYAPEDKGGVPLFKAEVQDGTGPASDGLEPSQVLERVPLSGTVTKEDFWIFDAEVLESVWRHVFKTLVGSGGDGDLRQTEIDRLTVRMSNLNLNNLQALQKLTQGDKFQLRLGLSSPMSSESSGRGNPYTASVAAVLYATNSLLPSEMEIWSAIIDSSASSAASEPGSVLRARPLGVEWAEILDLSASHAQLDETSSGILVVEVCAAEGRSADFQGILGSLEPIARDYGSNIRHKTVVANSTSRVTSSQTADIHAVTILVSLGDAADMDWCKRWLSSFAVSNQFDRLVFVTEGLCSVTSYEAAQISPDVLGLNTLVSATAEELSRGKHGSQITVQQVDYDGRSPPGETVKLLAQLTTGGALATPESSRHSYETFALRGGTKVFAPFWVHMGRSMNSFGIEAPFPSLNGDVSTASEVQHILEQTCIESMSSIVDPASFQKASSGIDSLAKRSLSAAANSITSSERARSVPSHLRRLLESYKTSHSHTAADLDPVAYEGDLGALLRESPQLAPSISLLSNAVGKHRDIFLGKLHPLQVLFAKTNTQQQARTAKAKAQAVTGGATDVYTEAVLARVHKDVIKAIVGRLCSLAAEKSRPVSVLEVGAGTGSTALPVLELLSKDHPGVCAEYAFTDLGTHFLNAFGKKYSSEYDFLRPAPLDIAKDPRTQGFASNAYDIVICVNVLHATPDISITLKNCQMLLAPGGVLLLQEITTQTSAFLDATFGLTEGWWAASPSDPLRPSGYPTLDAQGWHRAFKELGFAWSASTPADPELALDQQAVFVAQKNQAWGSLPRDGRLPLLTPAPPTPPPDACHLLLGSGPMATLAAGELIRELGCRQLIWIRPHPVTRDEGRILELAQQRQVRLSLIQADISELQVAEILGQADVSSSVRGVVWVPGKTSTPSRLFSIFQHLHTALDDLDKFPDYLAVFLGVEDEKGRAIYMEQTGAIESLVYYRRHRLNLPTGLALWPVNGLQDSHGEGVAKIMLKSVISSCSSPEPRLTVLDFARTWRETSRPQGQREIETRRRNIQQAEPAALSSPASSSRNAGTVASSRKDVRRRPEDIPGPSSQATHSSTPSLEQVTQQVVEEVRCLVSSPQAITRDAPLMMAGVDSLAVVELRETLVKLFPSISLSSTYIYDLPTSSDIGEEIHSQLLEAERQQQQQDELDEMSSSNSFLPTPGTGFSKALHHAGGSESASAHSDDYQSSYFPPQNDNSTDNRIAVISMECRMPGGMNSSTEFWQGLRQGLDAMVDIPQSRFDVDEVYDSYENATRGKTYVRRGGFLDRAEYFDMSRFDIPAAQIEQMDPQQRILLEVVDEALQQAGYGRADVKGTDVSVYIGVSSKDWAKVAPREGAYLGTGIAGSIVSNRISFELGLTGTSMSIDTACSSSLVAVDLAVQALRQGKTGMAVAGGINLNLHADPYVVLCGSRMLSPDGTCKALDAAADGYARSEGCGVVVLKRLADALRDRDPVVGVISGSYSNQDGRSTNISAPNGRAQQELVRRALADAHRAPEEVDYVELHGTGTSLGDPVEVHALKGVFGAARRAHKQSPLWLGAVKSNVGHLEPAAGVAGLIKTLWVVNEREVPPNIHMNKINPGIDFGGFDRSSIPQRLERIKKEPGDTVVAGCSSFGFGGTNVHIVVESPPPHQARAIQQRQHPRLTAATMAAFKDRRKLTSSVVKPAQPSRSSVPSKKTAEVLVLAFTGQGSQSAGMARDLYGTDKVFTSAVDECLELASREESISSEDLLRVLVEPGTVIEPPVLSQISLFVVEYALYRSVEARGIVADVVVGHSIGEIAAAVAAGSLTLAQGLRLVCQRAVAMEVESGQSGTMYAVMLPHDSIEKHISDLQLQDSLAVAAVNGYNLTTVSGSNESMQKLLQALGRSVTATQLSVTKPFHSPLMASSMPTFAEGIAEVQSKAPGKDGNPRWWSTVTAGELMDRPDAKYWERHALGAVLYEPAIRAVSQAFAGRIRVLEVGPKPVLCGMMQRWARAPKEAPAPVPLLGFASVASKSILNVTSLQAGIDANQQHVVQQIPDAGRQDREDVEAKTAPADSYMEVEVPDDQDILLPDCNALLVGSHRTRLDREREGFYPWRRGYHALMTSPHTTRLGAHTHAVSFQANHRTLALVADHVVRGRPIMPGAGIFDLALGAVQVIEGLHPIEALPLELRGAEITRAVVFAADLEPPWLRVVYNSEDGAVSVQSRPAGGGDHDDWIDHASGTIVRRSVDSGAGQGRRTIRVVDLEAVEKRCTRSVDVPAIRAQLASRGLRYGPQFQALKAALGGEGECLGTLQMAENGSSGFIVHPGLFDSAMQSCSVTVGQMTGKDAFAVGGIGSLRVYAFLGEHRKGATVKVWSRIISSDSSCYRANLDVCDNDGNVLFAIEDLSLVKINSLATAAPRSCLYVTEWALLEPPADQSLTASLGLQHGHGPDNENLDLAVELDHAVGIITPAARRPTARRRLGPLANLNDSLDRLLGPHTTCLDLDLLSSPGRHVGGHGTKKLQTLVVPLDPADTAINTTSRLVQLFKVLHECLSANQDNVLGDLRTIIVVTFESLPAVHESGDGELQDAGGLESSPAWGLLRTARLEFQQLRLVTLDLDSNQHPIKQATAVLDAVLDESEDEIAWRDGCRYIPRLTDLGIDIEAGDQPASLDVSDPAVGAELDDMLPRALDLSKAVPVDVTDAKLARIRRGYALTNALSLDSLVDGVKAVGAEEVVPLQKQLWQRYSRVSFDRDSNEFGVKLPDLGFTAEELAVWFEEALNLHPEVAPELRMLKSVYRQHKDVFRGGKDPLELLFRSNQHSETAGVYSESFYARYYNTVVAHAFSTFARAWLADRNRGLEHGAHRQPRPLRILEVGAGSGSTSRKLLQTAATLGISVDYYFTDISETFLRKASGDKTITAVPGANVTFKLFNAELGPRTQGLASSTFDVVVGVNVIHATKNLFQTMTHVRQLLRPRGIVILSEIVQPGPISDATFGMTEGWWRFEDRDLRPDYPLMDTANWDRLLHATDFDRVRLLRNAKAGTAQAVIVGQAASWPATRVPIALSIDPVKAEAGRSVYLVTGGTGGLGLLTAIVLLEQKHCDKVYLLSRSGKILPNSAHVWDRLEAVAGPDQVEKVQCDVSSASQVSDVFDSIRQNGEHVRGIVHSSGVLRDAMLQNQTRTTLTPVFGAKAEALRHLHDLSLDLPHLRHFIIFSSASALLGSPGQANHSSANAFLDAFAANRRAQGLPALCLQWGTVMGLGEAARKGANKLALKFGHGQLSETAAEAVLKAVFASNPKFTPVHSVAVSPFDWNTFTKSRTKVPHITRSFTSSISAKLRTPTVRTESPKPSRPANTARASKESSSTSLTEMIQSCVEATISHRILDESTTFYDAGVDSLSAIEFRNRLQSKLGNKAKLGASLVFDYPTVERLQAYLESVLEPENYASEMRSDSEPEPNPANSSTENKSAKSSSIDVAQDRAAQSQVQPKPTITVIKGAAHATENKIDTTISIVGMDCRLPTAGNTDELWHSLLTGKDSFRDIPFSRWDLDDNFYTPKSENRPSRSYVKQGAFLTPEHLEWFDNKFFNISEAEARSMDPNQRLLLEVSYQALADAGYTRRALRGQNIGLFVGFMNYDQFFLANKGPAGAFTASSASPAALSNRVSHVLGLEGPSCTIDTACSSSLYALHMAIAALRSHQCDAAVVAGVNVMMSPAAFVAECAAGMLSATERCHALDANADGFARGEGCAAIVIQRRADAESQNRRVHANILGTAVGHDGTTANLTSPNGPAQSRIIKRALADAGASPETISFVEGHFTGTVLGDPIEFHALKEVFAGKDAGRGRVEPLHLGALKSNLGHLEGVAGVAGLIKAVLALVHKQLPPIAHLNELNPHLDLDGFDVSVPRGPSAVALAPTSPGCSLLRAGVSSFGFSGANAHVVLEAAGRPSLAQNKALAGKKHSYSGNYFPLRRHGSCHAVLGNVHERLPEEDTLQVPIGHRLFALIQQHVVRGIPTVPGAMLVEVAAAVALFANKRAAAKPRSAFVEQIFFAAPFTMDSPSSKAMTITYDATGQFTIAKEDISSDDGEGKSIVTAYGQISEPCDAATAKEDESLALSTFQEACSEPVDVEGMWKSLESTGISYSGHFRSLQRAFVSKTESKALGYISQAENGEDGYIAHPAILDSGMQVCAALVLSHMEDQTTDSGRPRQAFLPYSMKGVRVSSPSPRQTQGREFSVLASLSSANETVIKAKLSILDEYGTKVFDIDEVTFRPSSPSSAAHQHEPQLLAPPLHNLIWEESSHGPELEETANTCYLLVEAEERTILSNAVTLDAKGPVKVIHSANDIDPAASASVYYFLPTSATTTELSALVLDLVKILSDQGSHPGSTSSLWIITRSCQTAPFANPQHAAIWGMVRCLRLEDTSGLDIGLCDLVCSEEAEFHANSASRIFGRLPVPSRSSNEWAWNSSADVWLVPRLVPDRTTALEVPTSAVAKRGLNSLEAAPIPDFDSTLAHRLDDNSVLIRVQAAGLNFHDVVFATYGATSEAMDDGSALGVDFSGIVEAVGSNVDHVKPGDSVFGMADGSMRTQLVCHGSLVRKLEPQWGWSAEDAAAVPTIFSTAQYMLQHLAHIEKGQTVLIHTATGGLGNVLVRMAQNVGARVIATAGSKEKRKYLTDEMGVESDLIATSRDAKNFSNRLRHLEGKVDIAINTLSGDYIPETLRLLKAGGKFFETGKLAIWTPQETTAARPDVEYHVVHLTQPQLLSQFLTDLQGSISQGAVKPPRLETFQYPAELKEAFEHVRSAQHIGKVVLRMDRTPGTKTLRTIPRRTGDPAGIDEEGSPVVREDATYVVTGGNSGLGLVAAGVLVDAGARNVVLLSRSGVVRETDAHVLEYAQRAATTGCRLEHWTCDVSDKAEFGRIKSRVKSEGMPPVRGVVHAAGVLHDVPFREQTRSTLETVMDPKVQAAENIVDSFASDLDFLVLFSSAAGLIGTVDQVNYGAANAALDAMAGHWRTKGLPVISVAWGLVIGLGILARRPPTRGLVERLGVVSPDLVRRTLRAAIIQAGTTTDNAYQVVAPIQWEKLLGSGSDHRALFGEYQRLLSIHHQQRGRHTTSSQHISKHLTRRTGLTSSNNPLKSTGAASIHSVESTIREVLSDVAAVIIPEASGDIRLDELGMDSLSSMELGNRLNAAFSGLHLSPMAIHSFPTLASLAQHIHTQLSKSAPAAAKKDQSAGAVEVVAEQSLVELNQVPDDNNPETPVGIIIHGAAGEVHHARALAAKLTFKVYGLRQTAATPSHSIAAMAAHYVRLLSENPGILRPRVQLMGYSFGGCVAWEMARVLEMDGPFPPERVFLLDGGPDSDVSMAAVLGADVSMAAGGPGDDDRDNALGPQSMALMGTLLFASGAQVIDKAEVVSTLQGLGLTGENNTSGGGGGGAGLPDVESIRRARDDVVGRIPAQLRGEPLQRLTDMFVGNCGAYDRYLAFHRAGKVPGYDGPVWIARSRLPRREDERARAQLWLDSDHYGFLDRDELSDAIKVLVVRV